MMFADLIYFEVHCQIRGRILFIPYQTVCWRYYKSDWTKIFVTPRNTCPDQRMLFMDLPISPSLVDLFMYVRLSMLIGNNDTGRFYVPITTKFRVEVGVRSEYKPIVSEDDCNIVRG